MKLISFSNFIPEQIADTVRFVTHQGNFRQANYCKYVQDFISCIAEDTSVDGAVFPNSCDSARSALDYSAHSLSTSKYLYQLKHPTVSGSEAVRYFSHSIEQYKESVESYFKTEISAHLIMERTDMLRKRGQYLYALYENIGNISYGEYITQINTLLSHPVSEWEKYKPTDISPMPAQGRKRVYVVGPFLTNTAVLMQMERSGLKVAGDNLTNSKRLAWKNYTCEKDTLYADIAEHILATNLSPTIENFGVLLEKDLAEIKEKDVKGVVFLCQKFCEPYDYLYVLYRSHLERLGIGSIRVYVDAAATGGDSSIWESFAETLS
jgi:benzoyl-CoA reductase/2-hydroxyglutaryl-CoA dehydratase subunit BcrC/BadD/HgdB